MNKLEQFYKDHPEIKRRSTPEEITKLRQIRDEAAEREATWTEEQWQEWENANKEKERQSALRMIKKYDAGHTFIHIGVSDEEFAEYIEDLRKQYA